MAVTQDFARKSQVEHEIFEKNQLNASAINIKRLISLQILIA